MKNESALSSRTVMRLVAVCILTLGSFAGIVIQMAVMSHARDAFGILRFYTIQSNILVVIAGIVEIVLLARRGRTGKAYERLRMAVVIAIMVTGIIFTIFLAKTFTPDGAAWIADFLLHYFTPLAAFVVWILFAEKGFLHMKQTPLWVAFPLLYALCCIAQAPFTHFYPYWFLNPHHAPEGIGSGKRVAIFIVVMCAIFLLLGSLMVLIDRTIAKRQR